MPRGNLFSSSVTPAARHLLHGRRLGERTRGTVCPSLATGDVMHTGFPFFVGSLLGGHPQAGALPPQAGEGECEDGSFTRIPNIRDDLLTSPSPSVTPRWGATPHPLADGIPEGGLESGWGGGGLPLQAVRKRGESKPRPTVGAGFPREGPLLRRGGTVRRTVGEPSLREVFPRRGRQKNSSPPHRSCIFVSCISISSRTGGFYGN